MAGNKLAWMDKIYLQITAPWIRSDGLLPSTPILTSGMRAPPPLAPVLARSSGRRARRTKRAPPGPARAIGGGEKPSRRGRVSGIATRQSVIHIRDETDGVAGARRCGEEEGAEGIRRFFLFFRTAGARASGWTVVGLRHGPPAAPLGQTDALYPALPILETHAPLFQNKYRCGIGASQTFLCLTRFVENISNIYFFKWVYYENRVNDLSKDTKYVL
jgi:hypothetical protein